MGIGEDIQKLQQLHAKGVLNDKEFADAKAGLVADKSPSPPRERSGGSAGGWGCLVVIFIVGLMAWASNPDESSLKKGWSERHAKALRKADANMLETVAANVLVDTDVERIDYFFLVSAR